MLKSTVVLLNAVFALALLPAAFADQSKGQIGQKDDQAKFQEKKQHYLERIDQRIAALQKYRGCIASAQDKKAAKACRPEHEHEGDRDRDHDRDHDRGKSKD